MEHENLRLKDKNQDQDLPEFHKLHSCLTALYCQQSCWVWSYGGAAPLIRANNTAWEHGTLTAAGLGFQPP